MKLAALSPALKVEIQEFLKLGIPLASAQVAQAMTGFVDTLMMGRLGQTSLAAGGLAVMVLMACVMTGIGIVSSVSPLAAEAYGANRSHRVGQVTHQGLWLAVLITVPVWPLLANFSQVMPALGQDPEVVAMTHTYLTIARWGFLPALWFAVLRCTVTALSRARPILFIMVGANVFNVVGNYVLAFGKLGLPPMGLAGLAIASALSHLIMGAGLMGYVVYHRRGLFRPYQLFDHWYRWQPQTLSRLLSLGLPIGVVTILENGLFTVMTLMVGALGTAVLAAQQLALQTIIVVFMVPLGLSYAATARVGQWYGRGDWVGVKRAAAVGMALTISVMTVSGVLFVLLPTGLIGLYLNVDDPANQQVVVIGVAMLTVAGFGQVVDGVQRTANGILQGLQDTRVPMLISSFAFWGVGILSGYGLGFHTSLGGVGIWIGAYLGLATAAIGYLWRFRRLLKAASPVRNRSPA